MFILENNASLEVQLVDHVTEYLNEVSQTEATRANLTSSHDGEDHRYNRWKDTREEQLEV